MGLWWSLCCHFFARVSRTSISREETGYRSSRATMSLVERTLLAVQKSKGSVTLGLRHWECGDSGERKGGEGEQREETHVGLIGWDLEGCYRQRPALKMRMVRLGWGFIDRMTPFYNENDRVATGWDFSTLWFRFFARTRLPDQEALREIVGQPGTTSLE